MLNYFVIKILSRSIVFNEKENIAISFPHICTVGKNIFKLVFKQDYFYLSYKTEKIEIN
jgi:hypothetical protein